VTLPGHTAQASLSITQKLCSKLKACKTQLGVELIAAKSMYKPNVPQEFAFWMSLRQNRAVLHDILSVKEDSVAHGTHAPLSMDENIAAL